MENNKCDCAKKTERSQQTKKQLVNRLSRIEGQIRGLKSMVENDAYCADILVQSAAASAAIKSFNKEIIDRHIKGCVTREIKDGNDEVTDELVVLLHKLMK